MNRSFFSAFCLLFWATHATALDIAQCLRAAYPGLRVENQQIYFENGQSLPIGSRSEGKSFTQLLAAPTIADQFAYRYPLEFTVPKAQQDAGRIRHQAFFQALYGATADAVAKNSVNIIWQPSGQSLRVNQRFGAARALENVGAQLVREPDLVPYVAKSLGTFHFRQIAGTSRLSAHSFAIAIDFQLPTALHHYWRWAGCKNEEAACPYPKNLLTDTKLQRIVTIFEQNGFIWGGKWAAYDSVHFEYRPELLHAQCRD